MHVDFTITWSVKLGSNIRPGKRKPCADPVSSFVRTIRRTSMKFNLSTCSINSAWRSLFSIAQQTTRNIRLTVSYSERKNRNSESMLIGRGEQNNFQLKIQTSVQWTDKPCRETPCWTQRIFFAGAAIASPWKQSVQLARTNPRTHLSNTHTHTHTRNTRRRNDSHRACHTEVEACENDVDELWRIRFSGVIIDYN